MSGFVDVTERAILDHFLGIAAWTVPATLYLGLSSTTPTDSGGGFSEPTGGGYARMSTTAADWAAATGTAPATATNSAVKIGPTATANWAAGADLTHFGVFGASTGGTPLFTGVLDTPKPVLTGDTPVFGASSLRIKLGDPGDTF